MRNCANRARISARKNNASIMIHTLKTPYVCMPGRGWRNTRVRGAFDKLFNYTLYKFSWAQPYKSLIRFLILPLTEAHLMHIWKTFKVSYVYPGIAKVWYADFQSVRLSKSPKRLWKSRLLQASLAAAEKSPSKSLCKCLLYFDTIPSCIDKMK